jgi:hypothetical protein
MLQQLSTQNWTIHFGWVNSHTGIEGNELSDRLARAASAGGGELKVEYEKTTKSTIGTGLEKEGIAKWQRKWERTNRAAL